MKTGPRGGAKQLLTEFLRAKESQVLQFFSEYPNAWKSKRGAWVYIPGKRPDRVLLVAHADTVRYGEQPVDLLWAGDVVMLASTKGNALGGDDRAGCAMLASLYDGQHSLLVTTGEERGCTGARQALDDIQNELAKHQFAVQIDRWGNRQAVFYDISTEPFRDYMISELTRHDFEKIAWHEERGSCTDVKVICPKIGICGVNLSAGFVNEHSDREMVILASWMHTRTALKRLLKQEKIEKFELPKEKSFLGFPRGGQTAGTPTPKTDKPEIRMEAGGIVIPAAPLSAKKAKKLCNRIKQEYVHNRMKRYTAYNLLDVFFKVQGVPEHQIHGLITSILPFGGQYFIGTKSAPDSKSDIVVENKDSSKTIVMCIECKQEISKHDDNCSRKTNARIGDRSRPRPGECPECHCIQGYHLSSCSLKTPLAIPAKTGREENFGQGPLSVLDIKVCYHNCYICRVEEKRSGFGNWHHRRVSKTCGLHYHAPCLEHSPDSRSLIEFYTKELDEAEKKFREAQN